MNKARLKNRLSSLFSTGKFIGEDIDEFIFENKDITLIIRETYRDSETLSIIKSKSTNTDLGVTFLCMRGESGWSVEEIPYPQDNLAAIRLQFSYIVDGKDNKGNK